MTTPAPAHNWMTITTSKLLPLLRLLQLQRATPGEVKTLEATETSRSGIVDLRKQKTIIIISWPPTFIAETFSTPRTPTEAQERYQNCTLESIFPIIIVTRFSCTCQSLVAKGILLGERTAAPTPFHVKRSRDLHVICKPKG